LTFRLGRTGKGWLAAICVAGVLTADSFIAYGTVEGSGPAANAAVVRTKALVQAVPVVLPPAPVTLPPTSPPAASPAAQGSADLPSSTPSRTSLGTYTVAEVQNGTPSNITDPSEAAKSIVPSLPLYTSPGAPTAEGTLPERNYLGAELVLLVTAVQGAWVQAYVPQRPNESTAWVPAADVTLYSVPCHIVVSIGAHKLVLYCNNAQVFETDVATGAPDSPTPTGSFFVAYVVKVTDPSGPYGPWALGTSAFSNTYYSFEGGPGQIGIHGTDQPWVVGTYASHGCVRLTNAAISELAPQVVPGTPVEIGP